MPCRDVINCHIFKLSKVLSCLLHQANLLKGFCSFRSVDLCASVWLSRQNSGDWDFHSAFLVTMGRELNSSLRILSLSLSMSYIACERELVQRFIWLTDRLGQLGKCHSPPFFFILKINRTCNTNRLLLIVMVVWAIVALLQITP